MKKLFGQEGTSDVPSIATVLAKLQTNNPSVEDYEEGQEPSVAEKAGYQIEKEHCIYVRLIDFGQLREAKEAYKQEQWGVTVDKSEGNALSGKIRVRRSEDPNGNVSYELTVKNRAADGRSSIESTVPSTEEQFKQFKYMSDKGMVKHRYVFDAGNGKQWELDVAPNGDGGWYNWARLELEVDDLEAPLPKLPIKVEEVIMPREKSNLSPEEWKEKTDKIMNKYFVKKNAILENDSEEAKQIAQESFDRAEHVISTKHLTGLAVEGFMDTIKKLFSSKKDQPKEEPYEQTKVKGNLLDFMRAFNVNKFEVEEGTIDLNGLSTFSKQMLLKGDSVSTDLVKDIGDTVNWIDTVSKNNLPIFKSWAKELSNLNDNLDKLDGQADVNVLKGQIVNVFKSAKGSPDIVNNYKTNPNILGVNSLVTKNYRGDLSFIEPRNVFSGKVDTSKAKYNKLTKEQVIKLKSYYDHISSKINDFAFMEDVYTVDMTDAPIRAVYPELTDDDWKIIWAKKCYIVDVAGATFTNIIGILGEVKYGLLELIGGLIRESVSSNVSNEGFVDSVKDMFKNKYQDKTLNTLVKDMKNFTNEPAPKKLDADIEIILMSYHEYYVTNVKLAARKKLSMNVNRFKELSTNDPKALDAMSNEVLDEAKKADKGYWPVVDKVQKEVEKAHGWDKVNVLIKFLKETNGDKALYKAHGSIMLQAGVDDVADIYDESNKDDITITKVVDIVWNDNNDDYKVAAMDNPKLSKSLTKMCYKLNDIDN